MIHKKKLLTNRGTKYLLFFPENGFDSVCLVLKSLMIVVKEFNQNKSGAIFFNSYCKRHNIKREQIQAFQTKQRFEQRFFAVYTI